MKRHDHQHDESEGHARSNLEIERLRLLDERQEQYEPACRRERQQHTLRVLAAHPDDEDQTCT